MNNSELEKKLKAARGPDLEESYLVDFPRTVLDNLHSALRRTVQPETSRRSRLVWGLAAATCLVIAFVAAHWRGRGDADHDVLANSKLIQETLAMFPHRVRAIVRDEHGMRLILSDQADVPDSTPIYVRICDGKNCSSAVTFSGQEIPMEGQKIMVLSDANGGIILEGNKFVWSSTERTSAGVHFKIGARSLGPIIM